MTLREWIAGHASDRAAVNELASGQVEVHLPYNERTAPLRQELLHLEDFIVSVVTHWTLYLRPVQCRVPPPWSSGGYAVNGWGMLR